MRSPTLAPAGNSLLTALEIYFKSNHQIDIPTPHGSHTIRVQYGEADKNYRYEINGNPHVCLTLDPQLQIEKITPERTPPWPHKDFTLRIERLIYEILERYCAQTQTPRAKVTTILKTDIPSNHQTELLWHALTTHHKTLVTMPNDDLNISEAAENNLIAELQSKLPNGHYSFYILIPSSPGSTGYLVTISITNDEIIIYFESTREDTNILRYSHIRHSPDTAKNSNRSRPNDLQVRCLLPIWRELHILRQR